MAVAKGFRRLGLQLTAVVVHRVELVADPRLVEAHRAGEVGVRGQLQGVGGIKPQGAGAAHDFGAQLRWLVFGHHAPGVVKLTLLLGLVVAHPC
ncbi:MAG: hypothetical protein C4K60_05715 [Ideonella sp. MAG2]|nr:MAG: hypothetical protein C4K60_05715 [Ideonella sp. MAG2]